jgi:hypothetical protein
VPGTQDINMYIFLIMSQAMMSVLTWREKERERERERERFLFLVVLGFA